MWGLVFIAPQILPHYPAVLLACGRYLAFGLIALPLAWLDRKRLGQLSRADWIEATKLTLVGNFLYYICLAAGIQKAGGALPTMLIGTLPVVIAISSNLRDAHRDGRLRWRTLLPSLLLIALGVACVNQAEWALMQARQGALSDYLMGAALTTGAVACWTWYPLRNADWMRHHADRSSSTWATAQGLATLPLALVGYALFWLWHAFAADTQASTCQMPFGPQAELFLFLMIAIGLLASWLGTVCWNQASQRLPTSLVGQLIVFETLSALTYTFVWRGTWPQAQTILGILLLISGVMLALRNRRQS